MKKWKIILPVFLVCVLGAVLYYCFIWPAPLSEQARADIPLVSQDGVRFGSSARTVAAAFGAPLETEKDSETGRTYRTYRADMLDRSADVRCGFAGWSLIEMDIRWELASPEEARALFGRVTDTIAERYRDDPEYFVREEEPNTDAALRVVMGLEYGATGIYYTIELTDSTLSVKCFDFY